jgi:integrase
LKAIVSFKPKTFTESRLHALLCLVMDTGVRISEALDLRREKVDFDNLLLTVPGNHCHIHLISRRKGDVENPRGGIRRLMFEKGNY